MTSPTYQTSSTEPHPPLRVFWVYDKGLWKSVGAALPFQTHPQRAGPACGWLEALASFSSPSFSPPFLFRRQPWWLSSCLWFPRELC